jgi:hypothetical protein
MIAAGITYYAIVIGYFQTSADQDDIVIDLEPLYEPEPVEFSFDTPAWYIAATLVLIALLFGLRKWYQRYSSRKYRRMAVKKLERLQINDSLSSGSSALSTIQITLKQVAMATYGRPKVAALYGKEWLQFLEGTGKHTPFTKSEILIGDSAEGTAENNTSNIGALRDIAKKWIKTHA